MGFHEDDLTQFRLIIREEIRPIRDMAMKHDQTLYGERGNNGLYGEVRSFRKRMRNVEILGGLIQGIVISVLAFKDHIFGAK